MLRWLFVIAVAANIALFAWFQRDQFMRTQVADRAEGIGEHVESLTLLSEAGSALRERKPQMPSSTTDPTVPATDASYCIDISQFPSQQAMLDWQASLPASVGVSPVTSGADEYWVYIDAPNGLQARQSMLDELRNSGLEVSVIQRGENKGALSLGQYADRELAISLYEGILAQGYPAKMKAVGSATEHLVLRLSLPAALADSLDWLDEKLRGTPYAKSEKKVCQGVASVHTHE